LQKVEIVFEDEMFYMNGICHMDNTFFYGWIMTIYGLNSTWRKSHIGVNNLYDWRII
jgi:hypothetical protein